MSLKTLEERLSAAVAHFWRTRGKQLEGVGGDDKKAYAGTRGAVVGGAHLHGFASLVREILLEGGLEKAHIYPNAKAAILPGFFRPTKQWDLIVVAESKLIATVEFKSQVGSFGNNFNNRVEEAVGNATDIHTAFREGAFEPSPAPWLGYLMLLEDSAKSNSAVRVSEPHFKAFEEFQDASYTKRYELFCKKLVRERLYSAACLIKSSKSEGVNGVYHEPSVEIGFKSFAASLIGHASGIAKMQQGKNE
jgi:Restriction endonuclease XhoI